MAPLISHLVIGERVFKQLNRFDATDYGSFLLGCLLVDLHFSCGMDRRKMHFSERFEEEGPNAYHKSCENFVNRFDDLLLRPWPDLTSAEQAFVAGYLCHLGADEEWKRFDCQTIRTTGVKWWQHLPAPVGVILTAFDVQGNRLFSDFPAIAASLDAAQLPDVLTHAPHGSMQAMWTALKRHLLDGRTTESFLNMLPHFGRSRDDIEKLRLEHEVYWEKAMDLLDSFFGGVPSRMEAMTERSLERMKLLQWS